MEGSVFTQGSRQMRKWVPPHMDSFTIIARYFICRGKVNLTFLLTSSTCIALVIYVLLWHRITTVQKSPLFYLFSHSHISLFPSSPPLSLMQFNLHSFVFWRNALHYFERFIKLTLMNHNWLFSPIICTEHYIFLSFIWVSIHTFPLLVLILALYSTLLKIYSPRMSALIASKLPLTLLNCE